jgi:hypothetical protein
VPDFTKILELTGPKALGLFFACVLLRLANIYGFVALSEISTSAAAVNDVIAILSGALVAMWLIELVINWFRGRLLRRRRRAQIRDWLSTLGVEEEELLRSMLASNQQSVSLEMIHPVANRLVQKGLLTRASGSGNILAWSFTVPPDVWSEMQMCWPHDWFKAIAEEP